MTTPRSTETKESPLTRDLIQAARYYLGSRRGLLILAGLAIVAGLALNWSWLAAAGIAPILISVLPCLAMCALGLCMNRASGKSCSTAASTSAPGQAPASDTAPLTNPEPQPSKERRSTDA